MANNLVIVESPAKVNTIQKFLGSHYEVMASNGHVRDLPKSKLGIDVDHDFEPHYITIRGKGDLVAKLKKAAKKADKIYLATDPDREGEAISWHLKETLGLPEEKTRRITFNEITKNAVKASIKNPRDIDMALVDAQQARRMLDRIVGYRISPILWAKVRRGLSAGRVQSAALRMICDREAAIEAFVPEEYWTIEAKVVFPGEKKALTAHYHGEAGTSGRHEIKDGAEAQAIVAAVEHGPFTVSEIRTGERTKNAPLPFTTSTLQQEASKQLNFSTQKTMRLAQQLYEGVTVKGHGTIGLITYLRTDSTRISEEAAEAAHSYIEENYGAAYTRKREAQVNAAGRIQDAHEAIRPTVIELAPAMVKDALGRDQFRLYQLIWKRFVASRMSAAVFSTANVRLEAAGHEFTLSSSRVKFDGFLSVYTADEEKEENTSLLSGIEKGTKAEAKAVEAAQHFTQPPAHFTEAALVHALEEQGIGRPSTYAPTITTLLARHYVAKEGRNLFVTELGDVVNQMMMQSFPAIVDAGFTATMESQLDAVEKGTIDWHTVLENFYPDLDEAVKQAEKDLEHVTVADEVSDVICENCGANMVIKYGPHGKFLACPNFPNCRNTKPYFEKAGIKCPKCGKDLLIRRTRKGRRYFSCEGYPECDFMSWQKPNAGKAAEEEAGEEET